MTDLLTGTVEHRYYVHGAERTVAMVRPQAAPPERTLYVHVDHLGSVEALTNEAGTIVERRSYDAFGARRNPAWGAPPSASFATTSSLGFTGHEDDAELGLVNMRGRLYDPHLSRFLTPDPFVAKPGFGQSWNPYSYVLNGPLSHVDPTGFTEEPADAVVSPGGFLIIPEPSDEPYVDMVWQVFAVGTESEEPSDAPDSGAAVLPQDANTWGNNAGWLPQPSATAQELPRQNSVGLEIYIGVAHGTAELALDAAKSLVLNALTFGGYGTWQLGKAIWAGYEKENVVGALNAVNPLYQLARGGADTYMAAERGNYRAAGAASVKTVALGTAAVVGVAQGLGALAGRGALSASTGGALVTQKVAQGAGFGSFHAFKSAVGPAGHGMQWHHVVEQTRGNLARFGPQAIHNTGNLVRVEIDVHRQISGFYSSIQPQVTGSTSMTVRQWLSTQSMAAQQEFGFQMLKQLGAW